jgi:hypothetical protein
MIRTRGDPGVIKRKKIICKYKIKFSGNIAEL